MYISIKSRILQLIKSPAVNADKQLSVAGNLNYSLIFCSDSANFAH